MPVMTPRLANRKQFKIRAAPNSKLMENSRDAAKPTMMIKDEAKRPFTMPAMTSPIMMDEGLIGDWMKTWNVLK